MKLTILVAALMLSLPAFGDTIENIRPVVNQPEIQIPIQASHEYTVLAWGKPKDVPEPGVAWLTLAGLAAMALAFSKKLCR